MDISYPIPDLHVKYFKGVFGWAVDYRKAAVNCEL
jgi:hypothetical protein